MVQSNMPDRTVSSAPPLPMPEVDDLRAGRTPSNRDSRHATLALTVAAGAIILTAFAAAMLHIGGARLGMPALLGLTCGGAVVVIAGLILVGWSVGNRPGPTLALSIVMGSVATSLFLVGGCFLTGYRAGVVFLWWSVLVVASASALARRSPASMGTNRGEVGALVAIAVLAGVWCRQTAALLPAMQATGLVPAWSDYFIHGAEIARFGGALATGRWSFALSGQVGILYHFASYMLPAAVSSLVDLPGVALAASVWFPFGVLLMSVGAYALVRTLASPGAGLLAPVALLLVPDVATYGLKSGFFSLHWCLGASPGTGYALGVAFTAITLAELWRATAWPACLWACALITLSLFQVRAQVFLLFAPAIAATLLEECGNARWRPRFWPFAALIVVLTAMGLLAAVPAAWDSWRAVSAFGTFLETVHTRQTPSAYDGLYMAISVHHGRVAARLAGIAILIPALLGALTVVWPISAIMAIRRSGWRPLDAFPVWCLTGWLALVLVAPQTSWDAFAYQYYSFPLVYASCLLWTAVGIDRAIEASRLREAIPAVAIATLGIGLTTTWADMPQAPRLAWSKLYFGTHVDRGLIDAAAYVRGQSAPGDVFALIPVDPNERLDDASVRFAALADVPAYLSRPGIQMMRPRLQAVVRHRVAELQAVEAATDPSVVFTLLGREGITWLVVVGPTSPAFDPQRTRAAFRADGALVYRIR